MNATTVEKETPLSLELLTYPPEKRSISGVNTEVLVTQEDTDYKISSTEDSLDFANIFREKFEDKFK